ncbi:uncharacterized protein LOC121051411 [Rosa chinensis]|uniref:uncharacterized protein LOC121051411 n=1 Tax=Rosa chinensis TaxID=74649 RepID=UPI001AD8EA2C|nr:uncharacterized protein LOC121051411 [Rosa chinensis]
MGDLCEDLWVEILGRLSSEKDLVPCMSVSKLWHRITSGLWVQRFWAQSPPLGLFFRTATTSTTTVDKVLHRMNYISLYNYHAMEDNLESTRSCGGQFYDEESYRTKKSHWQYFDRQWYKPGATAESTDRDEYLNGCNGLVLLMKSATYQFYVCNPITRQQVAIPKACVHQNHDNQHFCAALAFDPSESAHHFRVVRIDYSASYSAVLDIFLTEYGLWVRHWLQIDPGFTEGFKSSKLCRHFVYLRGRLYSIALSWNLLCIDLNTVAASALELPVPEDEKTGAMGCLGVSMNSLCYMKRMLDNSKDFHNLAVWYNVEESGEWILRYSVSCRLLGYGFQSRGYDYDDSMEPCAISPTSDLLFYGNPNLICCIHLKSEKMKFVCETISKIDPPASFLTLRACFVPFYTQLNKRNDVSTPLATACERTEILSVEVPYGKQEDGESVEVINVKLYDSLQKKPSPSLVYPSEIMGMHLKLEHIPQFLLDIMAM